ncbi:hypothetical protein J4232_05390 [Candidatus Woesearchaeota archaeon]|nr:hypothetical protein [Candidatus Woesearchaeota archaeon]
MVFETNQVAGAEIIVLNLIPFIIRKPKYLLITALLSIIILFLLIKQ